MIECDQCGHEFAPMEPSFEDRVEGGYICKNCLPEEDYEAMRDALEWD